MSSLADDGEALPGVLAVAGEIEFGGPEEGVVGEAAADGFLEGAGDFADEVAAGAVELGEGGHTADFKLEI